MLLLKQETVSGSGSCLWYACAVVKAIFYILIVSHVTVVVTLNSLTEC